MLPSLDFLVDLQDYNFVTAAIVALLWIFDNFKSLANGSLNSSQLLFHFFYGFLIIIKTWCISDRQAVSSLLLRARKYAGAKACTRVLAYLPITYRYMEKEGGRAGYTLTSCLNTLTSRISLPRRVS